MHDVRSLTDALSKLKGRECFGFVAGGQARGSVICVKFEPKTKRRSPLRSSNLPGMSRNYDSDFCLYIECAWRLDGASGPLGGCGNEAPDGGLSTDFLENLIGRAVINIDLDDRTHDLVVGFDGEVCLRIFCTEVDSEYDNYTCVIPGRSYTVTGHNKIVREETEDRTN